MQINLKQLSDKQIESSGGREVKMRLSENASSMVFQMFTKNIYSNPIGTVVREITSNCFDSHIEAGVNTPVVIRRTVDLETNTTHISFIDYGVGMSQDRVENIYGVYFESTKRGDNNQIGGFGIGAKSVLAYKRSTGYGQGEYDNSFYVITVYNGTKYYYCMYEGNESPVISLLYSEETQDRNGTEVKIPVLQKDVQSFKKEMIKQLYYFENIVFDGFDDIREEINLTNDYQIVKGRTFLYRGQDYSSYMHVCLGRVAYPIDYSVLGLNSGDYNMPIAINLGVGAINVTVSRETLDYNEATIKLLKSKLEEAKTEILDIFAKQFDNVLTLEDYLQTKNKFGHINMPNGGGFKVGDMVKFNKVKFTNFKYSGIQIPEDKQLFKFFFESKLYGKKTSRGRRRYNRNSSDDAFEGSYDQLTSMSNLYHYTSDVFERKMLKQGWLKSKHERYYMISPVNAVSTFNKRDISDLFNVHDSIATIDDDGCMQTTDFAQRLLELQNDYFEIVKKHTENYDEIEVPQDFVIRRKQNLMSAELRNTSISMRFADSWGKSRVKLDDIFKLRCPIFYATQDNEEQINQAARMFKLLFNSSYVINSYSEYYHKFTMQKERVMFIIVAKNNLKYMQYCYNAMPVEQFYNKMLYRKYDKVMQYFQPNKFIDKYNEIGELYTSNEFAKISPSWEAKISDVRKFVTSVTGQHKKDMARLEQELASYFPIANIKLTKEQLKYVQIIDEVLEMQSLNKSTLKHIQMPYSYANVGEEFWSILKKVLVY